jgi:hypothetical protein
MIKTIAVPRLNMDNELRCKRIVFGGGLRACAQQPPSPRAWPTMADANFPMLKGKEEPGRFTGHHVTITTQDTHDYHDKTNQSSEDSPFGEKLRSQGN